MKRLLLIFSFLVMLSPAVLAIEVQGVTVLSKEDVRAVLAPFEAKPPTLENMRAAAAALTALYRRQGYFLSRAFVPDSFMREGKAWLSVLEGRLADVDIQGNRHYSKGFLKSALQPAVRESVARYDTFMKALLLLNEYGDLRVRATLQPGEKTGTSDVLLTVEDALPFHVTLDANNYGTRYIGTYRTGLTVGHGDLTGVGDNLSVRGYVPWGAAEITPFLQAVYARPVNDAGDRVSFSYVHGAVAVGDDLASLDLRSNLTLYGFAWSSPLLRSEALEGTLSVGVFAKTFDNSLFGQTLSHDELRELTVDWSGGARWHAARTVYDVSLTQGLGRLLGGNANTYELSSRFGAGNYFTRLNADAWHVIDLSRSDALAFHLAGQVTTAPLVVGEQFGLGGPDTVRGFRPTEVLGDDGYVTNIELRRTLYEGPQSSLQGIVFVDHGGAFITDPLPGQKPTQFLTAAGLGLRGTFGRATMKLDCGVPLLPSHNSTQTSPVIYGQVTTTW